MSKKSLPILFPMVVLLFASLACNALSGGAASGFQATANAAFTQAAAGAATAGVQGSSAEATANAALTQAVGQGSSLEATANAAATEANATANAVTGGTDATATPGGDQPTAEATMAGGGTTADGGPADIPLVNANNTVLLASAQLVSYQTTADAATTIKFYKDAMPTNGWTADANTTVETPTATVLAFTKDTRTAQISITGDPTSSKTIVVITVS